MGLIFLVFICTQSCVRMVLYLHLSKQVYICVIPEVPYYLKRKHWNLILIRLCHWADWISPSSGVLGNENTFSGYHTACTYIYTSSIFHVYRELKNSHIQMLYSLLCIVNFTYICRRCLLWWLQFTPYCVFGGVFLRCVSQYFVSVLTVCTVPWEMAAHIDFDSALNVASECIIKFLFMMHGTNVKIVECIVFAHEWSYGSK